ncbi:DUF1840 domain-containing protein [Limnohabitans sp.]|uniref:DUF1840 domain-containing protein n=1 Tax=Limnohabitans sp. TaxID=1907725 RepID=UPI00286F2304|nr:DUF1840 domain-containing protein [Limnohabitans sp.]
MLYKFKSKATGDLIMLEPQGKHILTLIGKEPRSKGIIRVSEMLAAVAALQAAVAQEALGHQANKEVAQTANNKDDSATSTAATEGARSISLKQRVVPFIDMLQRAHAEDKEVVWGV